MSSSMSLCAKVQLVALGQDPLRARSLHMLTLYFGWLGPILWVPSEHFLFPCCWMNSTKAATTVLTASKAARHSANVGGSVST